MKKYYEEYRFFGKDSAADLNTDKEPLFPKRSKLVQKIINYVTDRSPSYNEINRHFLNISKILLLDGKERFRMKDAMKILKRIFFIIQLYLI